MQNPLQRVQISGRSDKGQYTNKDIYIRGKNGTYATGNFKRGVGHIQCQIFFVLYLSKLT